MKPSGAGFVGHVHVRSSSTFCATATHGPPRREFTTHGSPGPPNATGNPPSGSPVGRCSVEGPAQPRITWPAALPPKRAHQ